MENAGIMTRKGNGGRMNKYEEPKMYRNSVRKENSDDTIRVVRENIRKDFAANRTELKTMVETYNAQFLEKLMCDD